VPLLKEEGKSTSLIYIKDLIRGILLAADAPTAQGQTYYLTDGRGYSWREIILTVRKMMLGRSPYIPIPENFIIAAAGIADMLRAAGFKKLYFGRRVWDTMTKSKWLFSSSKAEEELGFQPRYELESGFQDMLAPEE
jgi:nucleoside-diphosphate-sugar epimerase